MHAYTDAVDADATTARQRAYAAHWRDVFADYDEEDPEAPHPYLPGLESFRETRMIGLSDAEKRKKIREAKRSARKSAEDAATDERAAQVPLARENTSFDTPVMSQAR